MILTLPFLGEREYLQGTTLLDALLLQAKYPEAFSFKIKKAIFSNRIQIEDREMEHSAVFSCNDCSLFVRELPPVVPCQREAFDEQALTQCLQRHKDRFVLPVSGISSVRGMVAAFKHILLTYYPVPERSGHWAFVRLDSTYFSSISTSLCLEKIFCRDGMACCTVRFDDTPASILYFAWAYLVQEKI